MVGERLVLNLNGPEKLGLRGKGERMDCDVRPGKNQRKTDGQTLVCMEKTFLSTLDSPSVCHTRAEFRVNAFFGLTCDV